MKHFKNITTLEELKKAYRELAKKNHPDLGGNLETMKEINTEYETLFNKLNTDQKADINDGYREIIDIIINLEGISIELCGSWVWVSGNTYAVKNELKNAGFYWGAKKKMWYWRPEEAKTYNKKSSTMDQIRNKYGSQIIKTFSKPSYSAIAGTF